MSTPRNPLVTSVSAFFPCYNDELSIPKMVRDVHAALEASVPDFEVIVVNDGSKDGSLAVLHALQQELPRLIVVDHVVNRGYGGALISGFGAASKEWVFYTDGDAQYDVRELDRLVEKISDDIDVVQGYKITRHDPLHRIIIGRIYHHLVKAAFGLKIRDVDCDFRLIRRSVFDKVELKSDSGVICAEMMTKIQRAGCRVTEVPVHHFDRHHGKSQFFNFSRIFRVARNLTGLWVRMVLLGKDG